MAEVALTYEELCKQRCEWCAKGSRRTPDDSDTFHHADHHTKYSWVKCAAPSLVAAYAELASEVGVLRERMEWIFGQGDGASWVDLHRYMSESNNIEQAYALIDADIRAARVKETK